MEPIKAHFEIVKVSEDEFDVLLFSSNNVLKSFSETYPESIFIENSKFGSPLISVPSFQKNLQAKIFIDYWKKAFQDPDKSCNNCSTVKAFFLGVEKYKDLDSK